MIASMSLSPFQRITPWVKIPSLVTVRRCVHTRVAHVCLAAVGVLLTACVNHTPPNLAQPLPAQWQHPLAATLLPAPDLHLWWKAFNAPDLDGLIDQSLQHNLTLAAAREHIQAARILAGSSPHQFLPDLHFATDELPAASSTNSFFRAGLQSSWELGLFGKKDATAQVAQGELSGIEAQAEMARVALVAEVVHDWVTLRTAQQQVILLNQMIEHLQQQIKLTEARVQLGLSPSSALAALQSMQSRQVLVRLDKQAEADLALEQLALLQGSAIGDLQLAQPTVQPVIADLPIQSLPTDLIRIRPDIQQAQATVLQATGELGVATAQRYPSVSIAGSYMYSLQLLGKFNFHANSIHGVGALGPEIDIPLFDWGLRKAKADAQGAELKAAVYAYRQTVLEAVHEVESSIVGMNTQQQRVVQQGKIVSASQQSLSAHQSLQQLGLASTLETAEDQQALLQAQLELTDVHKDHDLAYVAMYKALGGAPLMSDSVQQTPVLAARGGD